MRDVIGSTTKSARHLSEMMMIIMMMATKVTVVSCKAHVPQTAPKEMNHDVSLMILT